MNAHGHNTPVLPPMIAALLSGTEGHVFVNSLLNEWTDDGSDERRHVGRHPKNLINFIKRNDRPGRSVYFCIGTLKESKSRRVKENVREMAFAHADVDLKHLDGVTREEALEAIGALKLPPSVIVWSGHGIHLYWLLDAATKELERVEAVNEKIIEVVAGDRAPRHRAALMRVPGTTNRKDGDAIPCEVIGGSGARYTLKQLEAWDQGGVLRRKDTPTDESNPFLDAARWVSPNAPIDVEARLAAMEFGGGGDSSVHMTQLSVTAALTVAGWDEDEIVDIVLAATRAAAGSRKWNWVAEEKKVRKMCRDAARKVESGELGASKGTKSEEDDAEAEDADKGKGDDTAKEKTKKNVFELKHWYDLPEPTGEEWTVKGLLPRQGVATLFGAPGSYKSFSAIDIAWHVAAGEWWAGRRVRPVPVIYLAVEGAAGVKKRLSGARKMHGLNERREPLYVVDAALNLGTSADDTKKMIHSIEAVGVNPGLIEIDTLSASLAGGEENGPGMSMFLNNCQRIATHFNCLVIAVHHVGWGESDRERGHSSLPGNVDTRILVERRGTTRPN